MTPILAIAPKDRTAGWLTIECDEGIVVIPLFGPDHNSGMDCWCCPQWDQGVIVHNAAH